MSVILDCFNLTVNTNLNIHQNHFFLLCIFYKLPSSSFSILHYIYFYCLYRMPPCYSFHNLTHFQIFGFLHFIINNVLSQLFLGGVFFSQDDSIMRKESHLKLCYLLSYFTWDSVLAYVATSDIRKCSLKSHTHLFCFPFVKQRVILPCKNLFLCMIYNDLGSHLWVYKNIESGLPPICLLVGRLKLNK